MRFLFNCSVRIWCWRKWFSPVYRLLFMENMMGTWYDEKKERKQSDESFKG